MTIHTPIPLTVTPAMIAENVRAMRMKRKGRLGSLRGTSVRQICQDFMRSTAWVTPPEKGGYELATKRNWGRHLELVCRKDSILANLTVEDLWPGLIMGYLDGFADRPATRAVAYGALKALDKWASLQFKEWKPLLYGVKIERPDGGHTPWTEEQVALGIKYARRDLSRIIQLGAGTGQRISDLIRMGWSDLVTFQGQLGIEVEQKKTDVKLWVPFEDDLARAVATWEKRPGPFCLTIWDQRWTEHGLSQRWWRERNVNPNLAALKEAELVLHGLRGFRCVQLHRQGLKPKQIGDLVGMDTETVEVYTKHSDQKVDAMAALYHIKNFQGTKPRKVQGED